MPSDTTIIGLIPARAGSKRVQGKNFRRLSGHPLIAYTIVAALDSKIFSSVIVSTDSPIIAEISQYYGAEVPFLRPTEFAGDLSPDIEWIQYTLFELEQRGFVYDAFSILRPTSPFRQVETIQRAWNQFRQKTEVDSLRAVEKCKQHPGKMWVVKEQRISPLLSGGPTQPPWHSTPYQGLPEVYVQNASLEMAWSKVIDQFATISGNKIIPFFTEGFEGLDINDSKDWWYAEHLLAQGEAKLPIIKKEPIHLEAL